MPCFQTGCKITPIFNAPQGLSKKNVWRFCEIHTFASSNTNFDKHEKAISHYRAVAGEPTRNGPSSLCQGGRTSDQI
ncbi:hypothetical protein [Methanobrevibacter sp.]|uniref:hypothetical protein n=1 Tax=Methanobrevibacter sp. TaxID=66852 RepID=UPI00386C270B